ncbi:MAG: hypothetical protein AB7I50_10735 [Vicinamibacterales bacterium]
MVVAFLADDTDTVSVWHKRALTQLGQALAVMVAVLALACLCAAAVFLTVRRL